MTTVTAIVRNGKLELTRPIELPNGTEVEILLPEPGGTDAASDKDGPMTSEEIARTLAAMEKIEPLEMTEEERAALEADRQARKEWKKAHFDERAKKLRRTWE
jgi:hypothetical protein